MTLLRLERLLIFSENQQDIDTGEDEQEVFTQGRCSRWMNHHRLGWLARLPGNWPRTFALIFGVIIPLFLLILVSMFFGYGLAKIEAPTGIRSKQCHSCQPSSCPHDQQFSRQCLTRATSNLLVTICVKLFRYIECYTTRRRGE